MHLKNIKNQKFEIIFDDTSNPPTLKKEKKKYILILIVAPILFLIIFVCFKNYKSHKQKIIYKKAFEYCDKMYVNNILKNNIDIKDVNTCLNKIEKIENEESKDTLKTKTVEAELYLLLKNKITSYSNNGIVTS